MTSDWGRSWEGVDTKNLTRHKSHLRGDWCRWAERCDLVCRCGRPHRHRGGIRHVLERKGWRRRRAARPHWCKRWRENWCGGGAGRRRNWRGSDGRASSRRQSAGAANHSNILAVRAVVGHARRALKDGSLGSVALNVVSRSRLEDRPDSKRCCSKVRLRGAAGKPKLCAHKGACKCMQVCIGRCGKGERQWRR